MSRGLPMTLGSRAVPPRRRLPRRPGLGAGRLAHVLLLVVAALMIAGIEWSRRAVFTETLSVSGVVAPAVVRHTISAPIAGVVVRVDAAAGADVTAGEPLLRIEDGEAMARRSAEEGRIHELRARLLRLEAEASGSANILFPGALAVRAESEAHAAAHAAHERDIADLRAAAAAARAAAESYRSEVAQAERRTALSQEELAVLQPLVDRGISPRLEVLRVRQELEEHSSARDRAAAAAIAAEAKAAEAEAEIAARANRIRAAAELELQEARLALDALLAAGAADAARAAAEVVSPADGRLVDRALAGTALQAGATAALVETRERGLLVEAPVSLAEEARLVPAMPADVRLPWLPRDRDRVLRGTVVSVRQLPDADAHGRPQYRVAVRVQEEMAGEGIPRVPGLAADIRVRTGTYTAFDVLSAPFRDLAPELARWVPAAVLSRLRVPAG